MANSEKEKRDSAMMTYEQELNRGKRLRSEVINAERELEDMQRSGQGGG